MFNYLDDYFTKRLLDSLIFNKECKETREEIEAAMSGAISICKKFEDIFPFIPTVTYSECDRSLDIYWFRKEGYISWHYWFDNGEDPGLKTSLIWSINDNSGAKDNPTIEDIGKKLEKLEKLYNEKLL